MSDFTRRCPETDREHNWVARRGVIVCSACGERKWCSSCCHLDCAEARGDLEETVSTWWDWIRIGD